MDEFDLNEAQATAVLDLQARRFAKFERDRLVRERDDILSR
jgi:DNA gyrase/topoisomerase IV subunit A